MNFRSLPILVIVAGAFLAALAPAQPAGSAGSGDAADRLERTSRIIGTDVRNKDREKLGRIEDLVFNTNGRISYAVVSFGGFLNLGEKWFAMPWEILGRDQDDRHFVLDISKDKLKDAPGFDKKSWPDMADAKWCAEVGGFYSCPASPDRSWGGKASALDDATVKNAAGTKLGEVDDVIVDMRRGYATLVILDTYENVKPSDRLVAIPWNAMAVEPKNDLFVLNASDTILADAPTFTKDSWPALDRAWATGIYAHFGRTPDADMPVGERSGRVIGFVGLRAARGSQIIGLACHSSAGEDLGVVKDLILIQGGDRAPLIVLNMPEMPGTLCAVPLQLVRLDSGNCILTVDREKLRQAPSFSDNAWPDTNDLAWYDAIGRHYGIKTGN